MESLVPIISGGLGLLSAGMGAEAASDAGALQAQAARDAAAATERRWLQTRQDLLPFISSGYNANNTLRNLTGTNEGGNPLTAPLTRAYTGADLESTPGYKFTLDQGLKSLYNGYAARGLGNSTAAMKGASRYATGLAQSTFNQQLQNDLAQRKNVWDMIFPQSSQGAQSAGALANVGQQYSGQTNALMGTAAASQAAGDIGASKSWQSLLNPLAQYGLMYSMNPDLFKLQTAQAVSTAKPTNVFGVN